ncbi:MAG: hypothetical protein JO307_08350 [Bryobacterales bacterium]|nr:hypothetical protein [Bryobacterales bacterium]MBV9398023.1 hypothetical protein [Bryobacterales bacterium]
MKGSILLSTGLVLFMATHGLRAQRAYAGITPTTVTNATGTITQFNYDDNGQVEGFLIGSNVLLEFGPVCGGAGTLGAVGNSVMYSGAAFTSSSGFQSVEISSFTNNTTKASYAAPTSAAVAYGPTSGTIKQVNYAADGSIDGFLFTPSGTSSIFVSTGAHASSTLKPLLTVGTTVSVTGKTTARMGACSSTGELEVVDATSLTIGGQTIVIAGGAGFAGFGDRGGPRH